VTTRLLPYGPQGWLVELGRDDVGGFAAAVRARADPAVVQVVPAARTVLVELTDGADRDAVAAWLAALEPRPRSSGGGGPVVEIPVTYDGTDLAEVAAACGMSVSEVIHRHGAARYQCAFCGFAPGFAYLTGLDPALHLPRRPTPRTRVPAGAVAIAAEYTAVYPSPSPGGWHLIGTTAAALWDASRPEPSLIRPGTAVRFVAAR
jgi:KipI family sensor histidine kinase inhibitor